MNRHPELRSFLKDGDAKYYQGVQIKSAQASSFSSKAMLYIYHDGVEVEQVELSALATKDEMNQLMLQKGFQKKSAEFIQADQERRRRRRRRSGGDEQQEQREIETVHHVEDSSDSIFSFAEKARSEDANLDGTTTLKTEELEEACIFLRDCATGTVALVRELAKSFHLYLDDRTEFCIFSLEDITEI